MSEATGTRKTEKGLIARIWGVIAQPSKRFALGTLIVAGAILGVLFWGGFNWAMELANTESFCISCHEMRANPYAEMQDTIHYKYRSGVRATCPDCHVPKEWIYKLPTKIAATTDLFHHFMGSVDTPEKFEQKRAQLAQNVWAKMKATDSRECRNCHSVESMDPHKQTPASQAMFPAMQAGATCIDCHRGVAHKLPK